MVQYLYDNNIIIYTFTVLCGAGLLLRFIVNLVYKNLVKESDQLGETKNKMLRHMKMKFSTCYKLRIGVNNVDTFVDKNVLKYRFCGVLLSTWDNLCGQILYLMLLIVPIISVFGVAAGCGQEQVIMTGAVGILTSAVLIFVDKSINLLGKKKLLRLNLLDYLENFCKVRLEQEAVNPELVEQYRREYFQAVEGNKKAETAATTELVKEEPKDELNRRRQARLKKEEEKKLEAIRRSEEQRKADETRREEEKRKLEERRQQAARRREEERQKLEEEREALEARRDELKRKAEEKQQANVQKQKKTEEKQQILQSIEKDLKPTQRRIDVDTLIKGVEEIAAEKEQDILDRTGNTRIGNTWIGNTLTGNTLTGNTLTENTLTGSTLTGSTLTGNTLTENTLIENDKKSGIKLKKAVDKTGKSQTLNQQEEKLIEDVLKEFFA